MNKELVLGATASLALLIFSPVIQDYFPNYPYLPGVLCGGLFSLYYLKALNKEETQTSLHKTEWKNFKLIEKRKISTNTAVYKFSLPSGFFKLISEKHILGLPIGQHISIGATIGEKDVVRSYTPISSDDDKGFFELLIKTYPQGNISKFIDKVSVGETIRVKGPKIGMIAGGTGITPMLQIIKAVLKNPQDKTRLSLIFANVTEADILCKEELDSLAKDDRFNVFYVLNIPSKNFEGGVGYVTKEMIEKYMPASSSSTKILLCGPPPMIKSMSGYLEELGYPKAQAISKLSDAVFKF